VSFLPIGIVLGITPTHRDGKVQLEIDLNDSHIIGEDKTPSGPMPITKSWAFKSSVEVPLGHTLVLWNKAERKLYAIRPNLISGKGDGTPPSERTAEGRIAKKLKSLIFPKVQFSGATLEEALAFLRAKSRILDTSEPNEAKRGVNFILQNASASEAKISLDLKNVPLSDVVKHTADLAGMSYRIEEAGVVFLPRSNDSAAKLAAPVQGKAVELAKKYILPQVQFSKATVEEAVEFLHIKLKSVEGDASNVNLLLKPGGNPTTSITLDLKDVSAYEALRYIAELSNHTLSADDHTIILTPR
jgi:type II secretory pathway component GspD/PulD (secretin)